MIIKDIMSIVIKKGIIHIIYLIVYKIGLGNLDENKNLNLA